jgi:uncharacterized membrane protein (UPF0127 family)
MKRPRPVRLAAAVLVAIGLVLLALGLAGQHGDAAGRALAAPIAAALRSERRAVAPFAQWKESRVAVGARCLRLVLARTTDERRTGLIGRRDLGPYDGMLFVTPRDTTDPFTMFGTDLPLDLGLYAPSGLPLERDVLEPCAARSACPLTVPRKAYRLAIEAPRGSLPSGGLGGCGTG